MVESIKKNLSPKILIGNLIMIIGIVIFVTLYGAVFGSSNSLIGVCAVTAMLMYRSVHLSLKLNEAIITTILSFVFMGVSTQIALINPFLGLIINFISIFIISYLVTNTMETKAYLPFMLCYVFIEGTPITWSEFPIRIVALLFGGILIALVYHFSHRKKDDSDHMTITEMIKTMDKNTLQFNFSLRMALSVSVAMFLGSVFGVQKSMWISITAMSITQPHFDETKTRIKERFFGTLIGSAIFIVIFVYLVPEQFSTIVLLILSYIYTFVKEYKIKMIFITMNALGAAMILFQPGISVPMRIALIVVGICIAFIVNKVIYGKLKLDESNEELENTIRSIDKVNDGF
ncbi:TPA: FUSC family protein [Clostridium perfringens]